MMAVDVKQVLVTAAPLMRPILQGLILGVQKLFGHDNGTGPTKAQTVIDAALGIAEKLSTAGKITGQMDATMIATMMEGVIAELKERGLLPSSTVAPTVTPTVITPAGGAQLVQFTGTMVILK